MNIFYLIVEGLFSLSLGWYLCYKVNFKVGKNHGVPKMNNPPPPPRRSNLNISDLNVKIASYEYIEEIRIKAYKYKL